MFVFMCILLVLAGILLVAAVLIQPGKGAGLTAGMGGVSGQISGMFGARRTADFLQKFTIGLGLAILLLAVVTNKFFLFVIDAFAFIKSQGIFLTVKK